MNRTLTALTLAAAALTTGLAVAQTVEKEGILRDNAGRTLYTFDKDAGGTSHCYDACAKAWPPFLAKEGAQAKGNLTLHARTDGSKQWGVDGKPLYYFVGDAQPGDVNGDKSGGVWHIVRAKKAASQTVKPSPATGGYSYSSAY
jgi:predicted lipoprotein with Yx(FWY)xxD motif